MLHRKGTHESPGKWTAACGLASIFLFVNTTSSRAQDPEPKVIEIHAKKFAYEPAEITLHKGETYKLHLTSDDSPHSLRINALNLNAKMKIGEFNDVLFTPDQVGDFKADCGVYCGAGHKTMSMTVHVIQ